MNIALREARRALAVGSGTLLSRMSGRGSGSVLAQVLEIQRWPFERLEEWRRDRLRSLIRHAIQNVPWYAERFRGLDLLDPRLDTAEMLARIPILSKDDLRRAGTRLHAVDRKRPVHIASTSGSTGSPVTVQIDHEASAWVRAVQQRGFSWHDINPLEPRVVLLAAPQDRLHRLKHLAVDLAIWRRLFQFADLSRDRLVSVAKYIRDYRPSFITAYPSVLAALCWACEDAGIDMRGCGVKLLHGQSEMMQDVHREAYAKVFGPLPVLDEYGCVEIGGMAYSCRCGVRHPSHDHVLMEVVDDTGHLVKKGEVGRVLFTTLHARAMPLIRYEIGDTAVLGDNPCSDHFPGAPTIERIDGRTFEVILDRDGKPYSGGIVHFLVRRAGAVKELREYLAIQHERGKLLFQVVPQGAPRSDLTARIAESARAVFGDRVEIATTVVDKVDRPPGRKTRYFVSHVGVMPR